MTEKRSLAASRQSMLKIAAAGLTVAALALIGDANAQSLGYAYQPPMAGALSNLPPQRGDK